MTARGGAVGSDSADAVGLLKSQEERELPVTLPEVEEDEEQEDDSHPYSTWHALYGTEAFTMVLIIAMPASANSRNGHELGALLFLSH